MQENFYLENPGAMTRELALHFSDATVVGVDRSPSPLRLATQRHGELPNVRLLECDLEAAVPATATRFDLLFCQGVLHHMRDPGGLCATCTRRRQTT